MKIEFNAYFAVSLILVFIAENGLRAYSLTDVKNLKDELFNNTQYDRKIRPTLDQTKATEAGFLPYYMYCHQIIKKRYK